MNKVHLSFIPSLGADYGFTNVTGPNVTISSTLLNLPVAMTFRVEDDNTPEEVEQFVLQVTNAQLAEISTGTPLQVFFTNSTTVTIGDNDGKCAHLISLTRTCVLF